MRPRGYYVVFLAAMTIAVCHGYQNARTLSGGGRSYVRFATREAAETYAAWWQYDHPPPILGATSTKERSA